MSPDRTAVGKLLAAGTSPTLTVTLGDAARHADAVAAAAQKDRAARRTRLAQVESERDTALAEVTRLREALALAQALAQRDPS